MLPWLTASPASPSSRPPLCTSPGPHRRISCNRNRFGVVMSILIAAYNTGKYANTGFRKCILYFKYDQQPVSDQRPEGGPGEGGSKPGLKPGKKLRKRKALRTAPPPDAFFGSFLVRTQEMNTSQVFEWNQQSDKLQFLFVYFHPVLSTIYPTMVPGAPVKADRTSTLIP